MSRLCAGTSIEIKGWIAHRLRDDLGMPFFFRNITIVDVIKETEKAVRITAKFSSDIRNCCHFCGRDLDNDVSRATGIGPACASKHGLGRPTVEKAQETLKALTEMCAQVGTVGPFWLPKSQIMEGEK